jgi:hypothetical protein
MLVAAIRRGAAMLDAAASQAPPLPPPPSPPGAPPKSAHAVASKKRRGSVVGASVLAGPPSTKRRRRATDVGSAKKVRFSALTVARVPSGAVAGGPHPAEKLLAAAKTAGDPEAEALRCAAIRCYLAVALHPGDSSGAFGQRCVPADPLYLDMVASPTSYEACYADMSLVSMLTHALADAFLVFSQEAARWCVAGRTPTASARHPTLLRACPSCCAQPALA